MRLFLFDVDGTLIWAHGAGRLALTRALEAVYGTAGVVHDYDFRGKTDPQIVFDLLRAAGVPDDRIRARLAACFDAYVSYLEGLIADGHRIEVMPGIATVVQALSLRGDALVGLLTGNIERGARAKLRPTGLLPFFRVGAFGSDDPDRRRLPVIARERAQALVGYELPSHRMTIIGDTPLDVDCAHACGALAVAVATGQHRADELAACSPDLLLTDFSHVDAAILALTQE
jgi:phosphoglycolate phosphatase-like HAD superfamily hydrolase